MSKASTDALLRQLITALTDKDTDDPKLVKVSKSKYGLAPENIKADVQGRKLILTIDLSKTVGKTTRKGYSIIANSHGWTRELVAGTRINLLILKE